MKIEHRVRKHALEYWRLLKKDEPMVRRHYLEARDCVKRAIRMRKKLKNLSWFARHYVNIASALATFDFRGFFLFLRTRKTLVQMIINIYYYEKFKYQRLNHDLDLLEEKYGF